MIESKLSASLEDYLEAIYLISQDKTVAQANKIAEFLQVSKSSVSAALNRLSKKGLINYTPYEAISLTEKGKGLARRVLNRHEEIKNFLTGVLAINENTAQVNACRLEHVIDKEVLEQMKRFMDFLQRCPRAGVEWLRGFGYFCEAGQKQENCLSCLNSCREKIQQEISTTANDGRKMEVIPKVSKDRDEYILQRLRAVLHESGVELSEPEMKAAEVFLQREKHQTPEEIYRQARQHDSRVELNQVKRVMEILCEHKMARELYFQGQTLYEHFHPESHHDHLFCVKCGAIVEFFDPRIEALQTENARRADFRLLLHNLKLYGVCHECIRREAKVRCIKECLPGEAVEVVRVGAEPQKKKQLADMGLMAGTVVRLLSNNCCGENVIVTAGTTRIMLDEETADKIKVIAAGPEQADTLSMRHRGRHRHAAERGPIDRQNAI